MESNRVNVRVPTHLEEFIRRKMASGEFHSAEEVVCEGLRLLQHQESRKTDAREKIDIGWEQARTGHLREPKETRENLRKRKEAFVRINSG